MLIFECDIVFVNLRVYFRMQSTRRQGLVVQRLKGCPPRLVFGSNVYLEAAVASEHDVSCQT